MYVMEALGRGVHLEGSAHSRPCRAPARRPDSYRSPRCTATRAQHKLVVTLTGRPVSFRFEGHIPPGIV